MSGADPHILSASDPARSACVVASAGTGKTWLLVTRIVRLLLAGADPESILAVTFTRAAATEMRERLTERLRCLASIDHQQVNTELERIGLSPDNDLRERARHLYERLLFDESAIRITTFHGFCQELLRRFPMEAGVPPGFTLTEQTGILETEAWDALIAETTCDPDCETAKALELLFSSFGSMTTTRNALIDFLKKRADWWAWTEGRNNRVEWATEVLRERLNIKDRDPCEPITEPSVNADLKEFARLLEKHPTQTNLKYSGLLTAALDKHSSPASIFDLTRAVFLKDDNEPRSRTENQTLLKKLGDAGCAHLLQIHQRMVDLYIDINEKRNSHRILHLCSAWYRAGHRLLQHFQTLKRQVRALDFSDLEWKAYRLLASGDHAHWIQYKLDARIQHLLIDEFQDTNPTQWQLIQPLLNEMVAGENTRGRTVFLVGDEKQSIYRFRRAEPELMRHAVNWLKKHAGAVEVQMHRSRRSAQAIIDCVNHSFSTSDTEELPANFPEHSTLLSDRPGYVEISPLASAEKAEDADIGSVFRNPLHQGRVDTSDTEHQMEADWIARKIQQLIAGKAPIVFDSVTRVARYGDVMILLRRRSLAPQIETALRQAGIPFIGTTKGALLHDLAIRDLDALLRTLILPGDNLRLIQVLRSPLFSATDADLIRLSREPQADWIDKLGSIAGTVEAEEPLSRAWRLISSWRSLAGTVPVHDLLDRIMFEGDLVNRFVAAWPPDMAPRIRANLARFIELALDIDSGRYPSLPRFLQQLEDMRSHDDDAPDEAPPESDTGNRVRILTVHGAKGLEAPIVFLADATGSRPPNQANRAIVDWTSGKPGPEIMLLAPRKQDLESYTRKILDYAQAKERREKDNLLYVALTRARQMLFVSGTHGGAGEPGDHYSRLEAACADIAEELDGSMVIRSGTTPQLLDPPARPETKEQDYDPGLAETFANEPIAVAGDMPAPSSDSDSAQRGTGIHRLLQLMSESQQLRDKKTLRAMLRNEGTVSVGDDELDDWIAEAGSVLSNPDLADIFDPSGHDIAFNEVPVSYRDKSTSTGIIDRLILSQDRILIIDYKTRTDVTESNYNALARSYRDQLDTYRDAITGIWPDRKIETEILFTHIGKRARL